MKKTFFLLVILGSVLFAMPQNVDGGANALLNKVSAQYRGYASMQFNYTMKATKNEKTLSVTKGDFQIKGNKYRTIFGDQQIFCDGVSIWNFSKSTNEVSIYEFDPDDDQNLLNPQTVLKDWDKQFRAKFIRDEFVNSVQLSIIDLTPKTAQSYYRIRVFIDKASNRITKIAVYEKDNTVYSYNIEQFKANIGIDDKVFVFNKSAHPGVEINDMR